LAPRRFVEVRSNLWASPKYLKRFGKPAHPRDLKNAVFVSHPAFTSVMLTNGKSDFEVQTNGRIRVDDFEAIKALILLGEGIAWLPDHLIEDAAQTGTVVRVLPQWQPKQRELFYFVYASRRYALPKVEQFIQTALELV
jgi:DNA-binding transcriptional LysR family regulator